VVPPNAVTRVTRISTFVALHIRDAAYANVPLHGV
jgi:hypothetical protein